LTRSNLLEIYYAILLYQDSLLQWFYFMVSMYVCMYIIIYLFRIL
jgi:hypothetical protein